MTDTNHDDAAAGEQCRVCGGPINEGEGYLMPWDEETTAYVHTNCA